LKRRRRNRDRAGLSRRISAGLDEKGRQSNDRKRYRPIGGKAADGDSKEGSGGQEPRVRHARDGLLISFRLMDLNRPSPSDQHPRRLTQEKLLNYIRLLAATGKTDEQLLAFGTAYLQEIWSPIPLLRLLITSRVCRYRHAFVFLILCSR
jgi:hypothetical protein